MCYLSEKVGRVGEELTPDLWFKRERTAVILVKSIAPCTASFAVQSPLYAPMSKKVVAPKRETESDAMRSTDRSSQEYRQEKEERGRTEWKRVEATSKRMR